MKASRTVQRTLAAVAVLVCLGWAGALRGEGEPSLRERALKLNDITGSGPIKGEVQALLKDTDAAKKLVAESMRMAKEKPQPFNYNATLILATVAANTKVKDLKAAETFYRLHIEQAKQLTSEQGLINGYSGLIQLLYDDKKYAEAEKLCKEVLDLKGDENMERFKSLVLQQMILAIARQGDTDRAIDMIDRILKGRPDNWLALDLKARVLRNADKNTDAAKVYEDAIDRIKSDTNLKKEEQEILIDDIRYSLSGVYVDLDQVDKAAEQLKALLERDPDNSTYNNDLGYIWADHDMNLAESEKLIRKAIDEDRKKRHKDNPNIKPEDDKDNGAYLDSLGWVLYKQKKYKEAKKYLEQAVQSNDGKHIEIYDHLADIDLALGDKAGAIAAWKKGLAVAGDTKREQKRKAEVEKKIKTNE
jgi:tetratricopeptide (TPR) repeat protein